MWTLGNVGRLAFFTSFAAACGGGTATASGGNAGASGRLFVTVYGEDAVAVVDLASRKVVDSIPLGAGKGPAILLKTPDGSKLYTANWPDNSISSIDVATRAVHTIALGSRPWVEAMSPKGDFVYAGLNTNTIAVIRTSDDTVVRNIDVGGLLAESIIVSPDGATLYVAVADQNSPIRLIGPGAIEAIAADTGAVVHPTVEVGKAPAWITIAPDGSKVYTLNFISSDVSVIDVASWKVSSTIALPKNSEPIIGAVAPSGALVVTDFGTADMVVIDPVSGAVTHTLKVDGRPVGIDFSVDGRTAYATNFGHASLAISPSPLTLLSGKLDSAIGPGPGQIVAVDPVTGTAVGDPIVLGAGPTSVVAVE